MPSQLTRNSDIVFHDETSKFMVGAPFLLPIQQSFQIRDETFDVTRQIQEQEQYRTPTYGENNQSQRIAFKYMTDSLCRTMRTRLHDRLISGTQKKGKNFFLGSTKLEVFERLMAQKHGKRSTRMKRNKALSRKITTISYTFQRPHLPALGKGRNQYHRKLKRIKISIGNYQNQIINCLAYNWIRFHFDTRTQLVTCDFQLQSKNWSQRRKEWIEVH
jgi:hypothetical protein